MGTAQSLERARVKVEAKLLLDHCVISSDPQIFADDTFDTSTGLWSRPDGDQPTVYDGPCAVKFETGTITDHDGVDMVESQWVAKILLLESDDVTEGAILLVDASRDPSLVGRTFKVDEVLAGTFKITRKLRLSSLLASPRQWSDR